MRYKTIAVHEQDYQRMQAVKNIYEADFQRKLSWSEFLLVLATGYMIGKQIIENDNHVILEVQH